MSMDDDAPAPAAESAPSGARASLSRELSEFLVQLSIAVHKHAIYPPGHPQLDGAVDGVVSRLDALLATRPSIALGVARQQLVIEGVATDPGNALLRELAHRLHRHQVGALRLSAGATTSEMAVLLKAISVDADRSGAPAALRTDQDDAWPHLRLFPLSYAQLELVPDVAAPVDQEEASRAAYLWIGLARAALANDESTPNETDPTVVARAIDRGSREVAYDQVIVGYLLQIAEELKTAEGVEAAALRKRVSQLVGAMRPQTLRRLLEMGGDVGQRQRFVLDASQAMAVDAVVELAQAAADASGQTISHSMMRLLSKLALHAGGPEEYVRQHADRELREQVQRLVGGWELADPNPDSYRQVLQAMARTAPTIDAAESPTAADPARVIAMGLELGEVAEPVLRAVDLMLEQGRWAALTELFDTAPAGSAAVEALWRHAGTTDRLHELLQQEPLDAVMVGRLVPRLGLAAAGPLLDALASSTRRATRWKLLELIAELGEPAAPMVAQRLSAGASANAPWFVLRNLLVLTQRLGGAGAEATVTTVAPLAAHADARVRREAVRLLLRAEEWPGRERTIAAALADPDQGVAQLALGAAAERCPPALGPAVARRAADPTLEPHVRALALRALAPLRTRESLELLLKHAVTRNVFGRERLAPRSPESLAALAALAAHWRGDARADAALALATVSQDAEMRAAASGRSK